MTGQNFDINNLRIASPCSADWATMSGNDRKRSCDLCRLNVYNFSEMTVKEIEALINSSEGRVCGRLYRRHDGTVLTKDCPVGFRAYRKRTVRLAGAALTAVLGLFSISFGQKQDEKPVDASEVNITRTANQENVLSGKIIGVDEIIPNAEVLLRNGEIIVDSTHSDEKGAFSFHNLTAGNFSLEITAPNFQTRLVKSIEIKSGEKSRIDLIIELNSGLMGEVIIKAADLEPLPADEKSFDIMPADKKPEKPY